MATAEDQVEQIICDKWKFDRDENTKECMEYMGYPDEVVSFILTTKPTMSAVRDGDSFHMTYELVPGKSHTYTFKLNEQFDVKDVDVPPMFHNKETLSLENGAVKVISKSQLSGDLRIDSESHFSRIGDELHTLTSKVDDRSVVGNRVMVLDK